MTTRRARRRFVGMTARSGVAHQPGLDGLRGLAVAAVAVFHTGLDWLPGGFLGVSLFFTLSGVVIGTVILHELRATRHFSLRRFWVRRFRRLLPAAWIVLAVVAFGRLVTTRLSGTTDGDVLSAWLNVANWHFLARDQSYQDLFAGPSALLHFWSLAIEEQFYLVVGLLAIGLAAVSRRPARTLAIVAGLGAAVSFVVPILLQPSIDRVYYGTDTRAGELLVGLVLAAWLSASRRRVRLLERSRWVAVGGLVALGATAAGWRLMAPADDAIRTGLLPATSIASAGLILGAVVPGGLVFRLSTLAPLRALGAISYAVYLIHWPVFVVIATFSPSPWWRLGVGVPTSIALAVVSARLVELPIRHRRAGRAPMTLGAVTVTGLLAAGLIVPVQRSSTDEFLDQLADDAPLALDPGRPATAASAPTTEAGDDDRATTEPTDPPVTTESADGTETSNGTDTTDTTDTSDTTDTTDTTDPTDTTDTSDTTEPDEDASDDGSRARPSIIIPDQEVSPTTAAAPEPPTVGVFGDSIALSLALTKAFLTPSDTYVFGDGVADIGCGAVLSPAPSPDGRCTTARSRWLELVESHGTDLAVVMSCQWELIAQPVAGDPTVRVIGDPVFDRVLRNGLAAMVDDLRDAGARRVALVRCPQLSPVVGADGLDGPLRESRDPARVQRWNQLLDELGDARRDVVTIDLAAWVDERRDDATIRPDGEHFRYDVDTGVAAELDRLLRQVV